MNAGKRWNLPNLLSAFRLGAAPGLLGLALAGQRGAFLVLLAASFATDAIDGVLARRTGQVSRFGAMLDSWADVTVYGTVAVSVALLWPGLVRTEAPAVAAVVASFTVPALVGLARFRRFTSYHTRLVKVAVAATAVGLYLLLLGVSPWPFRLAAGLAVLAGLEEVAISLVLDRERSDVGGLRDVLALRRQDRDP